MSAEEIQNLWIPLVLFENTETNEFTKGDDDTELTVIRLAQQEGKSVSPFPPSRDHPVANIYCKLTLFLVLINATNLKLLFIIIVSVIIIIVFIVIIIVIIIC